MKKRRIGITLGAVVLVVGVVAGRERPAIDLIQEKTTQVARADDGIDLEKLKRGDSTMPQNDPFAQKNFGAEQRPAAPQAAPRVEKPTAPPLPFRYFGRLTEKGRTEVYVMRGDELLAVAAGQNIGEYRVDKVSESSIAFTYLPLKTTQTLELQ